MDTKYIICTICPVGCEIEVTGNEEEVLSLDGNQCKRGIPYATSEFLNPERILTTTAKINNYRLNVIPVRSNKPIPKKLLMEAMDIIKKIEINGPVEMEDVVIFNIVDTGADIVISGY